MSNLGKGDKVSWKSHGVTALGKMVKKQTTPKRRPRSRATRLRP